MKRYSEYDEQDYILATVYDIPCGSFLDVGAYDGEQYSNTLALVERGWSGVMVEPALEACSRLLERHGGSDLVSIVHGVVAPVCGLVKFWNSETCFSSTIEGHHWGRPAKPAYWTPAVTFEQLLKLSGPVDVLSIDAEGTSFDLLCAFPWRYYSPRCVCIEYDGDGAKVRAFMETRRYSLIHENVVNQIYAADSRLAPSWVTGAEGIS